jgi:hypothetical protein
VKGRREIDKQRRDPVGSRFEIINKQRLDPIDSPRQMTRWAPSRAARAETRADGAARVDTPERGEGGEAPTAGRPASRGKIFWNEEGGGVF